MIERRPILDIIAHLVIIIAIFLICFPIYVAFVMSTLSDEQVFTEFTRLVPSTHLFENFKAILFNGVNGDVTRPFWLLLTNSFIVALLITFGKITISIISAYAVVFFRFPLRNFFFFLIFITLMLPVEVRIFPTIEVVANMNLLNSYAGLTLPLIASATATFLFRQFFLTLPHELIEAAKIDGAGAMRFFIDIVLPLSKTNIAALFVITFIYGWNQYLWPLLVISQNDLTTAVAGIKSMITYDGLPTLWNQVMAAVLLILAPPLAIVLFMQRWFVKGLVDSEK